MYCKILLRVSSKVKEGWTTSSWYYGHLREILKNLPWTKIRLGRLGGKPHLPLLGCYQLIKKHYFKHSWRRTFLKAVESHPRGSDLKWTACSSSSLSSLWPFLRSPGYALQRYPLSSWAFAVGTTQHTATSIFIWLRYVFGYGGTRFVPSQVKPKSMHNDYLRATL